MERGPVSSGLHVLFDKNCVILLSYHLLSYLQSYDNQSYMIWNSLSPFSVSRVVISYIQCINESMGHYTTKYSSDCNQDLNTQNKNKYTQ